MAVLHKEQKKVNNVIIERLLHDSSNIVKTSYNYDTNQLWVTFKRGMVYYYNGISNELYSALKEAKSIGTFLDAEIKKKGYTYTQVGSPTSEQLNELLEEVNKYKNLL